jgi:hypothetical protein
MDRVTLPNGNGTIDGTGDATGDGASTAPHAPSAPSHLPVAAGASLAGGLVHRRYLVRVKVRTTHPFHGRYWAHQDYLVRVQGTIPRDLPDAPDAIRAILHRVALGELAGRLGAFVWLADPADLA